MDDDEQLALLAEAARCPKLREVTRIARVPATGRFWQNPAESLLDLLACECSAYLGFKLRFPDWDCLTIA